MLLQFLLCVSGIFALVGFLNALPSHNQHIISEKQIALTTDVGYSEGSHVLPELYHLRHKKKRLRHRGRKHRHHKRFPTSTSKRYFEKQFLVRNRTIALLGAGMEKFLPNAVDLLDINPQELPGESPFQNWHSQKSNQDLGKNSTEIESTVILRPTKLLEIDQQKAVVSGVASSHAVGYQYNYEAISQHEGIGQLQLNFGTALNKLLQIFSNFSTNNNLDADPCEQWMGCREQLKAALMSQLPACPCEYPSSIVYEDRVWDIVQGRYYRWRDASGERLDVYKPGAEYCIRSLLARGTPTLAAQHCCYDRRRRLLTRGSGAGNPNLVSPDVSPRLHDTVDVLPWRLCRGDFTAYHHARPPNNGNNCTYNPDEEEYNRQVQLSQYY